MEDEQELKYSSQSQNHIPGYSGYIPGVKSENLFGKTYGKVTTLSKDKSHHRGVDLPTDLRYTSTLFEEYQIESDPKTRHIQDFNPLKRNGQGEATGYTDAQRTMANYGLTMPEKQFHIQQETNLTYQEALQRAKAQQ